MVEGVEEAVEGKKINKNYWSIFIGVILTVLSYFLIIWIYYSMRGPNILYAILAVASVIGILLGIFLVLIGLTDWW